MTLASLPIEFLVSAFVTILVVVDPVGLVPAFLAVTHGLPEKNRPQVAVRACVIATIILAGSALIGNWLLHALSITLPAFRIAGGLLLFVIAFEMVFDRRGERKSKSAENAAGANSYGHVAVFPLAIPLVAGPASISATVLIASHERTVSALFGLIVAIVVIVAACLGAFMTAGRLEALLGETGRIVVTRLLGLILAALAVQFVADGVVEIVRTATA